MMIYFDNAATSWHKPGAVARATADAVLSLGNPGRGGYNASLQAAREVLNARLEMARLLQLDDPAHVAFTSGVTESLNLLIGRLVRREDHVITTVLEHNSVLRPLYQTGCALSFVDCDDVGRLLLDTLPSLLTPRTRFMVCTTGSNVLGSATDVAVVGRFCRENGLVLILDTAQTLGSVPITGDAADFLCFTGHKGLLGPQGTGGVVCATGKRYLDGPDAVFKTGGTGSDSFAPHQPQRMPDILEAGTPNVPGLCGLRQGVVHVNELGAAAILEKEQALTRRFLDGLTQIPSARLYGSPGMENRLPVVAFNLRDWDSEEVSLALWENHGIACRPGSHCAPLVHKRFQTEHTGMVRFSFGYENAMEEIDAALAALEDPWKS